MTTSRPRLLFLCQNLPYPPDGGALIRSFHTLRILAQDFEVEALCFYRKATRSTDEAVRVGIEGLAPFGDVQAFPIPQDHSRLRLVYDHARSVATGRAYTKWTYRSVPFRKALHQSLETFRPDLVHVDSLDLVAYLPELEHLPLVVAHHNVESRLLERRMEAEDGWRRRYIGRQARLTEQEEREWCPRVTLNVVVSPEDRRTLGRIAPGGRYMVFPNGVDTTYFEPGAAEPTSDLVFVGGHTWFPNRDGMEFFVRDVLPSIRERRPEVEVTWVGRAPDQVRRDYAALGVTLTGYVEDVRPFVHRAACVVVPLRVGGGTRLKILDAWAMGKAVVSTSTGCEGLAVRDGENIVVADAPGNLAEQAVRILEDACLRERLGSAARETAVENYDWDVLGRPMRETYVGLLEPRVSGGVSSEAD